MVAADARIPAADVHGFLLFFATLVLFIASWKDCAAR